MSLNPKITGPDASGRYAAEWTPDETGEGYGWTTDRGSGRTFNPDISKVNLGSRPQGGVPSFRISVLDVIPRPAEVAIYGDPPPPPPPPSDFAWGFCHSVSLHDSTILREYQDAVDMGCNTTRCTFNQLDSDTAKQVGFKRWMVIVEATIAGMQSDAANPSRILAFLAKNDPAKIILEPINEPTFMAITAEDFGKTQINWYHAVKAYYPQVEIVLSSMGNSSSSVQHLSMMDYAKRLASVDCVAGNGFDRANYHTYADEAYWHIWTPDANGQSVQSILGNPEFYVTEFGKSLSGVGGNEQAQADSIRAQAQAIRAQPKCKGAYVYAMSDDAPGVGTGYGMRRHDLSRRPAYAAYQAAAKS